MPQIKKKQVWRREGKNRIGSCKRYERISDMDALQRFAAALFSSKIYKLKYSKNNTIRMYTIQMPIHSNLLQK